MWFGWAQADLPLWLVAPLTVASVLAACIAVAAVVVAIRAHGQHTPMRNPTVRRSYLIIVGVEFAALGAGAGLLAATGLSRWICVWVCAGVGPHFLPLSRALGRLLLVPLGLLVRGLPAGTRRRRYRQWPDAAAADAPISRRRRRASPVRQRHGPWAYARKSRRCCRCGVGRPARSGSGLARPARGDRRSW